jgi:hypothetical protein
MATNVQRIVIGLDAFEGIISQTGGVAEGKLLVEGTIGETNNTDIAGGEDYWYTMPY